MITSFTKAPTTSEKTSTATSAQPLSTPLWIQRLQQKGLPALALILVVIVTYLPAWHAGFIWDDDMVVTANPVIVGPSGLKEIWTTRSADICPLTLTTFWAEHALWGLAPLPFHIINILLHGLSTVVLWRVLLLLHIPGAWLGAALWALHPVEVESVVWISELKNAESGLFFLLSILFFVKSLDPARTQAGPRAGSVWLYSGTLVFAALAMASKSSTVILPLVLGLTAWWIEGRWSWTLLRRLLPVIVMALAAGVVSIWTQQMHGADDSPWAHHGLARLAAAGMAFWFYLGKLLWPYPLMAVYPQWRIDSGQIVAYVPLFAAVAALSVFWWKRGSWARPWFFATAYFLAALLPVLGIANLSFYSYSFVSDHFQYLASMGPLALAAAGLTRGAQLIRLEKPQQLVWTSGLAAGLLLILATVSWQRVVIYGHEETLWSDNLVKNPDCWAAYNDLGNVHFRQGRTEEAIGEYRESLRLNPNYENAHFNLANVLLQKGEFTEAIDQFQEVLKLLPGRVESRYGLGNAYFQTGRLDEAIEQYQQILAIAPTYGDARNNLGTSLLQKGEVDEAIAQFQQALTVNAHDARLHFNLGNAFFQKGRLDDAIGQYQEALEINPAYDEARGNLGLAHFQKGEVDAAISDYHLVLQTNPNRAETYYNLGDALAEKNQLEDAIVQYRKALSLNSNLVQAHNNLGIALAQTGHFAEAIAQFRAVLQLRPNDTEAQKNLSAAETLVGQDLRAPSP
jgi:protein O-mannosyl-transferase